MQIRIRQVPSGKWVPQYKTDQTDWSNILGRRIFTFENAARRARQFFIANMRRDPLVRDWQNPEYQRQGMTTKEIQTLCKKDILFFLSLNPRPDKGIQFQLVGDV